MQASHNRYLETVLQWLRLVHSGEDIQFNEIKTFLDAHPVWPKRGKLLSRAEVKLDDKVDLAIRLAWFDINPPRTTKGRLTWIKTLNQAGRSEDHRAAVRYTWLESRFSRSQQRSFLRKYGKHIEPKLHWNRLDRLLWLGRTSAARTTMPLVSKKRRHLAEARIRLRRMSGGVDEAIRRVPVALRSDPGLIYERLRWRHRRGMKDKARDLLWDVPVEQEFPYLWWRERARQVRYALDEGRVDDAYLLAASHIQREGRALADAQWHAGWVALRFNDKTREAAHYFAALYAGVTTPISRARGAYWAGRAMEASGTKTEANKWYRLAMRHPTTFYGQLASDKLPSIIRSLPKEPITRAQAFDDVNLNPLAETVQALWDVGQIKLSRTFLRTLALAANTRNDAAAIAKLAHSLGQTDIAVYAARHAARRGFILIGAGYPIITLPPGSELEPALTHAIIRQESGFDESARSRAGALGLMQLMPRTARQVSKGLKLRYSRARLTTEPTYNIRLGSRYLQTQLNDFNGSYVLALAAYNAGPHRVRRWIKERGDPRQPGVDVIDWIERIPFSETRNYVQRVLEGLHVYRLRFGAPRGGWTIGTVAGRSTPDRCVSSHLPSEHCFELPGHEFGH